VADQVNWLCATPPLLDGELTVRLRYRQSDQLARVDLREDGSLEIAPDSPQRAVKPGQSAVVYRGTRCLGGGVITQTEL
jgi:tRNA-specific 2-thiouridylase